MFNIALFEPEIAPNCGNIIRLCANTGCTLHLIEPLGFDLSEKKLRRAGLDYHDLATVTIHASYPAFRQTVDQPRVFACTTKAKQCYTDVRFRAGDVLLFGPETRGLPDQLLDSISVAEQIRIPMKTNSRSLNLANAVAIVAYEAWRQIGFGITSTPSTSAVSSDPRKIRASGSGYAR